MAQTFIFRMVFDEVGLIPGSSWIFTDLQGSAGSEPFAEFGASLTRAGGQDDVSSNKLPQIRPSHFKSTPFVVDTGCQVGK